MLDELLEGHVDAAAAMGLPLPQWSHTGHAVGAYEELEVSKGVGNDGEVGVEVSGESTGEMTGEMTGVITGEITGEMNGEMTDDVAGEIYDEITGEMTEEQVYTELWRASQRFTSAAGLEPRSLEEVASGVASHAESQPPPSPQPDRSRRPEGQGQSQRSLFEGSSAATRLASSSASSAPTPDFVRKQHVYAEQFTALAGLEQQAMSPSPIRSGDVNGETHGNGTNGDGANGDVARGDSNANPRLQYHGAQTQRLLEVHEHMQAMQALQQQARNLP